MPLRTGTVGWTRLRSLGEIARTPDAYDNVLRTHGFTPIDLEGREEASSGWVPVPETDRYHAYLAGSGALSLRTDTLKPTAGQVRKALQERRREIEAAEKAPLSNSRLRDLKDMIKLELRKRIFSKTQIADVLFDEDTREVLLLSSGKKTRELLQVLWEYTFGCGLDVETAGSLAVKALGDAAVTALSPEPAFFLDRTIRDEEAAPPAKTDEEDEDSAEEEAKTEGADSETPESMFTDYRFLGREFLTWLACKLSVDSAGFVKSDGWKLFLGDHARLSTFNGGGLREVHARSADLASMSDLRFAVGGGLLPRELAVVADRGDRLWMFTLLSDGLAVHAAKLPSVLSDDTEDAAEERTENLLDLNNMVTDLYGEFLAIRVNVDRWAADVALVQEWVRDAVRRA